MTANLTLSIIPKALLETAPRSGWVYTKYDENSRFLLLGARLTNLVGYDPAFQGAIQLSYRVRIDFFRLSEVTLGRVPKVQ